MKKLLILVLLSTTGCASMLEQMEANRQAKIAARTNDETTECTAHSANPYIVGRGNGYTCVTHHGY